MISGVVAVLGLSSCEKMMRDMATKETQNQTAKNQNEEEAAAAQAAAAKPKEPEYELTFPKGAKYPNLETLAQQNPKALELIPNVAQNYAGATNWADKHADINGILLQNEDKDYYFVLQQQAANELLRKDLFTHYLQDNQNKMVLDMIGQYTDHLLQAKSEDSELMYKCLRALSGHWPKDKIVSAALVTAARAQARPIASAADTTTRNGSYRQIYARELKKMGLKLQTNS
ncbi:hypothetical protein [Rufibacter sp. LB8]|uniref:hypothetical protein n=1 Tax=Rufibacter sp. LB8 TaxID=2777781 RepID=UPI00178C2040|nr:hypothetical protein [Rufibacter sp. LB8]